MTLWQQLKSCSAVPRPTRFPADTIVLFAPRDNLPLALQSILLSAKVSLKGEMFTYTDAAIDSILHAKAAITTVEFQATFDESQVEQVAVMKQLLAGWQAELGKRVAVGKSEHGYIIHRKTWVIDHLYVVSGSTNWTHPGESLEDNELVIRHNAALAAWYEQVLDANFQRVLAVMARRGQPATPATVPGAS